MGHVPTLAHFQTHCRYTEWCILKANGANIRKVSGALFQLILFKLSICLKCDWPPAGCLNPVAATLEVPGGGLIWNPVTFILSGSLVLVSAMTDKQRLAGSRAKKGDGN
jgi:hypothetical protein